MSSARPSGNSERALVSVITPCHDAAPFIEETIESVAAQSYPAIEHIVVDDGSADDSWAIIEAHAARVVAMRFPVNRGAPAARNAGAARAQGEYLMFLDADDVLRPDAVDALVAAVRTLRRAVAVCRWQRLQLVDGHWCAVPPEIPFPPPADPLQGWLEGVWVPPCAVLWRRDAYELTGGWDERLSYNQDGDLMMRALVAGVRLVVADGGEALYRSYPKSETRPTVSFGAFSETTLRTQPVIFERIASRLAQTGRLPRYRGALGIAYRRMALRSFQLGYTDVAREFLQRAKYYAPRQAVSATWVGRILTALLGMERKEHLAEWLAGLGIRSVGRAQALERRARLATRTRSDAPLDERSGISDAPDGRFAPYRAWAARSRAE